MESEDDTHYTNDVDSVDSDCQDDDAAAYSDEEGCFLSDDEDGKIKMIQDRRPENSYIVLKESDIKERQEADITSVSSVLSISRAASIILLRHYNWNVGQVHEAWFSDDDKVRKSVGLLPTADPVVQFPGSRGELTCGICFDDFPSTSMKSAACSHHFCFGCWEGYIRTSINDGPECLMLRCPDPSCDAAVGQDMVTMFASDEDKRKYFQYLRRSYIEDNKKNKWCPGPGCENAINYVGDNVNYDVSCLCSHSFCWNCTEETHRPVDCSTVRLWIIKNSAESENMNWILANSKSCPKCQRPIEKNHGCMHMTCKAPCRFQFCWLCLGAWSDHNSKTGGFYACNRYEKAKREGVYDESERRRKMAKKSLERYAHYYERWASNESSRQKALGDLHQMQTVNKEKLSVIQRKPEPQLEFLSDAWQQIAECRRMLKWTYAYGYYLPEHGIKDKKQFFEHLQNDAESALERLHQCAEKELSTFLNADGPSKEFVEFQTKLAGLTAVTKSYFENLVRALENNLSDVDYQQAGSLATSSKNGTSRGKGGRGKGTSRAGGSSRN